MAKSFMLAWETGTVKTTVVLLHFTRLLSLQRETDSVRIKSKMIEDQTDTIRKLKEAKHVVSLVTTEKVTCFL